MLKKENRLKARRAFTATYNNKNVVSDDLIILYAGRIKTDENCPTRVGFVVSKKIHKRATKRNRIKRLIRENIRLLIKNNEDNTIKKYESLIFIAKEGILNKKYNEIGNSILILLNKMANKYI